MTLHSFTRLTQKLAVATGAVSLSLLSGLPAGANELIANNHTDRMADEMSPGEMGSEELSPEGMAQEDIAQEEMPSEDMSQEEEMSQEEGMSQEEMSQEEMSQEEMAAPTADTSTMSIVEVASGNDSFNTLVQAIQAADLAGTLSGPGPYTVFAPTDEAFAELPDGALEYLLQPENKALLQQVLTYHVVPGEITANELSTGSINALGGGLAIRTADDGRVIVNNGSVVQADVQASNGVIHAVNRVLLPSALRSQLVSALNAQS